MAKIEYEFTPDEYVAFSLFQMKHSSGQRRSMLFIRFFSPLLFIVLGIFYIMMFKDSGFNTFDIVFITLLFILAVLWFIFYPKYVKLIIRRSARKMSSGKTVLTLTREEIISITDDQETKTRWSEVNNIAENDSYIIIYLKASNAIIIPKKAFESSSAINSFVEKAKQYKEQYKE